MNAEFIGYLLKPIPKLFVVKFHMQQTALENSKSVQRNSIQSNWGILRRNFDAYLRVFTRSTTYKIAVTRQLRIIASDSDNPKVVEDFGRIMYA